jgi:hypothetical protein
MGPRSPRLRSYWGEEERVQTGQGARNGRLVVRTDRGRRSRRRWTWKSPVWRLGAVSTR